MHRPPVYIGTSGFTAAGWAGSFYPVGLKAADYLSFYAEHFETVEVDSTFYGCPSARTVNNWAAKVPAGFVFSAKAPQIITHDKALVDCGAELEEFLSTMGILGEKLGPIVLQFPSFDKWKMKDRHEFTDRLIPFLKKLPREHRFAIEIRNREWLDAELAGLLGEYHVALVLQDLSYMPKPMELKFDPITADLSYIRWLGDRRQIESQTTDWSKTVVDRTEQMSEWVKYCEPIVKRGVKVYAYANNHYSGYAPDSVEQFRRLWKSIAGGEIGRPKPAIAPRRTTPAKQGSFSFD
jgi:uncharacterized protein YecE (DUF72 family)